MTSTPIPLRPFPTNASNMALSPISSSRKAKLSQSSSVLESLQRFWNKTYAADYLGLAAILTLTSLYHALVEPFHQLFLLSDTRIQHPHADIQTVDGLWLFIYALGVPLLSIVLWALVWKRDVHKAHVTVLGLIISIFLTSLITDIFKNAIGRPRPDLLDRCKPLAGTQTKQFVDISVCTEKDHHVLHDGWRSFPSGHSSVSFAGLGWLALFLASQTRLFRPRTNILTVLLCLAPVVGAAMIAVSRLEDYRHDVFDVVAGSTLGSVVTYMNWRRYYPALTERYCEEAYVPASGSGRSSPAGFQRVRDEEEAFGAEEGSSGGYRGREGAK